MGGDQASSVGEASPEEFVETRARLERWPAVRRDVEVNLQAFEKQYAPFADCLEVLRDRMATEAWVKLVACHWARSRDSLRIDEFVAEVRSSMAAFEEGLQSVAAGEMSVKRLGRLHAEMVKCISHTQITTLTRQVVGARVSTLV